MVFPDIGHTLRMAVACREQARARAQCIMETFDGVKVGAFVNAYLHPASVPHPLPLDGDVMAIH